MEVVNAPKHLGARRSVVGDSSRRGFPQRPRRHLRGACTRGRFVDQGVEAGERTPKSRRWKSANADNTPGRGGRLLVTLFAASP